MSKTIIERLEQKYNVNENGCWIWHAAVSPKGKWTYGIIAYRGKMQMAHRVAYMEYIGEIPKGLELDHLCRTPLCVNPAHMEPVTHRENIRRGYACKPKTTHCTNGHEMTEANTYLKTYENKKDKRECRICRRAQVLRNESKSKA